MAKKALVVALCLMAGALVSGCPSTMVLMYAATSTCPSSKVRLVCDVHTGPAQKVYLLDVCGNPRVYRFHRDSMGPKQSYGSFVDDTDKRDLDFLAQVDWRVWNGQCPRSYNREWWD